MADLIDRQAAIDAVAELASSMSVCISVDECHGMKRMQGMAVRALDELPSTEPQKSGRYVDLSERVIGYYYDDEYEEWIEKTVTVEELLDTACEDYTVVEMPSVEPQSVEMENGNDT